MSNPDPASKSGSVKSGGNGSPSSEPLVPAPPPKATTTDLGRFPEKSETGEITTYLPADTPLQELPADGKVTPPAPSSEPLPGGTGLPLIIDPQIEIERRISAGGMGEVFLGLQKHLGRKVAVKRIRDWGADATTKERFIREAKAQSRLQHPGIAQVYDLREAQGELYLIMEYVEGRTLEEVLAHDGKFAPERLVSIGAQLTEALEAAAHEGYIHRDLKPGNVMLTDGGKVNIIDFGLALLVRNLRQTRFTEKGEVLGTPAFMSPEQLNQEENLDSRSDIWSLGVLLYTLATAETPFTGKDFVCTVKNVMMAEPVPLPTLELGFPPGLWQAIARALRKDRAERWQDYASFRNALLNHKEIEPGVSPGTHPAEAEGMPSSPAVHRRSGRRRAAVLLGTLLALLGTAAAVRHFLPFAPQDPPLNAGPAAREEGSPRPAPPPKAEGMPELAKNLPSAPERPRPPSAEKPIKEPQLKEAVATLAPLREKLAGYAVTEEEAAFVREILDLFSQHRPQLLVKNFGTIETALDTLERDRLGLAREAQPPLEKEYSAAQLRTASRMLKLAQGALLARLEELKQSREDVTLLLSDETSKTGVVKAVEKGAVTLAVDGGGELRIALGSILPESLRGQAAPATAFLALLALSGSIELSFLEIAQLSASREDFLFWIPIAVRLARLEVVAAAKVVATVRKESSNALVGARPTDPRSARVDSLAGMLAERKDDILRLFGHTRPDFEIVERERQALRFLCEDEYARVLAFGPGTAAFPVAAEVLLGRFETEVQAGHDELHARTGWHGYGWRLFPPERSLKEQEKYWDLDPEGNGSILQATEVERRVAMGKGAKRAPEGVLARVVYEPKKTSQPAPHWRFLVRSREGATNYLRFDEGSCALYRTRLEPGVADAEIARVPLPTPLKPGGERVLALVPIEGALHVLVDGHHVLAVPEVDAAIPMQMSFAVTQGKLWIQSVKVKKSTLEDENNK